MECVCIYDKLAEVTNLGRYGRAATIEKLFNAASGFEKYTILAAVNLLDRYLSKMHNSETLNVNDVQLTAMVALAVVMSTEPGVSRDTTICLFKWLKRQYKPDQIIKKEAELRDCLDGTINVIFPFEYASNIGSLLRNGHITQYSG